MSVLTYNPDRTVEILVYLRGKQPRYGTGYRIGSRLILTVAHVFPNGIDDICSVRSRMKFSPEIHEWEEEDVPVIWCDPDLDVALVLLPDKDSYRQPEPVKFGYFPPELSGQVMPFKMFGFPTWAFVNDGDGLKAGGSQVEGKIAVSDYSNRGLFMLRCDISGNDWRGMSGAAVFCDGYLIGVQIEHQNVENPSFLSAQPIEKLLANPEFLAVLKAHGFDTKLYGIEIQKEVKVALRADIPRLPMPVDLLGRDDLLAKVKQELLNFNPAKPIILLQTPGIGKSELTKAVLHQREISDQFPDGVLWVSLGTKPDITQELLNWAAQLHISVAESAEYNTNVANEETQINEKGIYKTRTNLIRNRIGEQRMVIFIDDVWSATDMKHFMVGGPNCATIITTRRASVIKETDVQEFSDHTLSALNDEDALNLLKRLAPDAVASDPEVALQLVQAVGGIPFAIVLMGKYLRSESWGRDSERLEDALEHLSAAQSRIQLKLMSQASQNDLNKDFANTPISLEASIELSESVLDAETRRVFHIASIFRAKPKPFSVASLTHVCKTLDEFSHYSHQALTRYLREKLYILLDEGLLETWPDGLKRQKVSESEVWAYEQASKKFTMSQIIVDYAYLQLDPEEAKQLHIAAAEYFQSCIFNYEENRTGESSPYERMYAYENVNWQQIKASWLCHLSFTGEFHANMAFMQLYFDAFYWWGEYLEYRPFCDEIIEEWNARYASTPDVDRTWLDTVEQFHNAYPFGYQNKNSRGNWQGVEAALLHLRKLGKFDGDLEDFAEDAGLRHLRVLTAIYLSEARRYQNAQDPQTLAYLDEALLILEADAEVAEAEGGESDDCWIIPWVYWQKADLFLHRGDLEQALDFVKECRDLSLDINENALKLDLEIIGNSYRVEADVLWEQGHYEKAFHNYTRAMFCAWGFHCGGGASLDFYTVAYHHEMMDRIQVRLKELSLMKEEALVNKACTYMQNFWSPYVPMQPIEDVLALLYAQEGEEGLAGHIFPPAPIADEVELGMESGYYRQIMAIYPDMAQAVFVPRPFLSPIAPVNFVGRHALIDEIKQRIQTGEKRIVLGQSPGIGKTALSAVLVHDADLRAYFQGGVLWAGLGQAPNIAALLGEWLLALNIPFDKVVNLDNDESRKRLLEQVIGRRRILLVLDDVWEESDLQCFMLDAKKAPNCTYLITTRRKALLDALSNTEPYVLPVLSKDESLQLLKALAPSAVEDNEQDTAQLALSAGGMPLALVLMGKYLNSQSRGGQRRRVQYAIEKLQDEEERLRLAMVQSPLYQPEGPLNDVPLSLLAMLSMNYSELESSAQNAFLTLSIHKPKPSVFTDDFRKAMDVDDADFSQLLEAGLIDEARQTAEDTSFYEGYQTGYSSKPGQEMAEYEADTAFYEIANIVKDFATTHITTLFDAEQIRGLHKKAAEYYSDWLSNFENINSDASPYERMYRYVWPRWQFVMGQLIDHLGEVDPHSAEMQFATLYFDAFWWWGNYLEFPFCEQLLKWGERYHYKAEWVWLDYVVRFHQAYRTGYYLHYDYEDRDHWREVQQTLEALSTYADENRPAELTDTLKVQYRHLRMVLSIFMAESFQYQDAHDPRAEQYYQQALSLIDHDDKDDDDFWNIPWLFWHLSTLYLQQGRDELAREFAEKALKWAFEEVEAPCQRDNEVIANAYRVLADVLFRAEDYEAAFTQYAYAVLYAWGFHACPNTPNFYSQKFHAEMLARTHQRLKLLNAQAGPDATERAYAVLREFWQAIYDGIADDEGHESIFDWLEDGDLVQFLAAEDSALAQLHILPCVPSSEAINEGLESSYYQLTRKAFLSRVE